ncbi:MAG: hypothetical protein M1829_000965 [Trizodia sp. TS-e1964]|nr:MAG: hypothetical protein M1829_000965 [Trizodia sp. TS-e1964]
MSNSMDQSGTEADIQKEAGKSDTLPSHSTMHRPIQYFGPFPIVHQIFWSTPLSHTLVNLRPLLPGHSLVISRRRVPRLHQLTPAEVADLFQTVQRVGRMLERVFGASSLNIGIQDGQWAGQSVPHVHAHIIPRKKDDAGTDDRIYKMLEEWEGELGWGFISRAIGDDARGLQGLKGETLHMPVSEGGDSQRKDRTMQDMQSEAAWLHGEMLNEMNLEREGLDQAPEKSASEEIGHAEK